MKIKLLAYAVVVCLISCTKTVQNEVEVYGNDFDTADLTHITNGRIIKFNNTAVLGNYNNDGFALTINDLPKHDLVTISYDLYIHDSWDGNKLAPDGPDIFSMLVDGNPYINASFSNSPCGVGVFCEPQSYPLDYPNNYSNPKAGAFRTDLPGLCNLATNPNGTTLYKIQKTIRHSKSTLILQCLDKLIQTNTADPKCDESWSVDNIRIKAIAL
ncbi:hypothetical protein [Mucilaginibacter glaciei]|uniref:Lipoprotein n=1 Tax=Mucilaginibacter glaciei TaxID=2772109 RepID=A0A926NV66_9SPHI|nr:hypothetical protein [Mucilaginibacter glaciei]MBD1392314.1 hypothetical protein [Mucilaginibacter glaciei]